MTEIREPNWQVDLPGVWEESLSDEPGTRALLEHDGKQILFVTLLTVKPVYDMAERKVLLDQYMYHRTRWEKGQIPGLEQSEPTVSVAGDSAEGWWWGREPESGRRVAHRVLLDGSLLADFAYEAYGMDEAGFTPKAESLLSSAGITAP